MKKKWFVFIGCIIINLCNVGYLQKHEDTGSSISAMNGNTVKGCLDNESTIAMAKKRILLKDYLGITPESDFCLYQGFYANRVCYPYFQVSANGAEANYYYAKSLSSLGYTYTIEDDKMIIQPKLKIETSSADRNARHFEYSTDGYDQYEWYLFVGGGGSRDRNATSKGRLEYVDLDAYYGKRKIEIQGEFPAFINCGRKLMINEEVLRQFIDIPVYETAEEKSEAEKQKEEQEKKVNAIFLGLCAVVIIFYQLKKRKLF